MERLLEQNKVTNRVLLVGVLLVIAICAPRFFLLVHSLLYGRESFPTTSRLALGIDMCNQTELKKLLKNSQSFAIIVNSLSTDSSGLHTIDRFVSHGFIPKCCFMTKDFSLGESTQSSYLYQTQSQNIPCIHLYSDDQTHALPYNDVDTLVFDLSDQGFTQDAYQKIVFDVMQYTHTHKKKLIFLDRPTQVSGAIEGALRLIATDCRTRLPLAHGLTGAELATFFNNQIFNGEIDIRISPMKHFIRNNTTLFAGNSHNDTTYIQTLLTPFAALPLFDTAQTTDVSLQCILLSESLGFDRHHWFDLRAQLKDYGIDARMYRYYNACKKDHMTGLQFFSMPGHTRKPLQTTMFLLQFFKQKGLALHLNERFDDLVGTSKIRQCLEGMVTHDVFAYEMNSELKSYFKKVYQSFLYKPVPIVVTV